ncbi:hypothetical protein CEQ48_09485 [Vibrio tarriae]|uniref:Uncharacterized protein n=1 Tax=Vibrio tarriae TaxID=2014742 RepID=A0AAU8WGY2_9VIBR|nr:hypothetical protein [Vibrio tarriae]ASK55012.1 hypothetical protein CEQ48_09485 [Vibrio tarriae]
MKIKFLSALITFSLTMPSTILATTLVDPSLLPSNGRLLTTNDLPDICAVAVCMGVSKLKGGSNDFINELLNSTDINGTTEIEIYSPLMPLVYPVKKDHPIFYATIASGVPMGNILDKEFPIVYNGPYAPWLIESNADSGCKYLCFNVDITIINVDSNKNNNNEDSNNNKDSNNNEDSNNQGTKNGADAIATTAEATADIVNSVSDTVNNLSNKLNGKYTHEDESGNKTEVEVGVGGSKKPGVGNAGSNKLQLTGGSAGFGNITISSEFKLVYGGGEDTHINPWSDLSSLEYEQLSSFGLISNELWFLDSDTVLNKNGYIFGGGEHYRVASFLSSHIDPMLLTIEGLSSISQLTLVDIMADPILGSKLSFLPLQFIYSDESIQAKINTLASVEEVEKLLRELSSTTLAALVNKDGFDKLTLHELLQDPSISNEFKNYHLVHLVDPIVFDHLVSTSVKNDGSASSKNTSSTSIGTSEAFGMSSEVIYERAHIEQPILACSSMTECNPIIGRR